MEERHSTAKVTRRVERQLLKIATEAVKTDFPNPERFGCPGSVALKRALLNLTIKLPLGMEDGTYSVQFRTTLDQSVANATGMATWNGSAETLTTTIDLRNLKPGPYKLAIRYEGSSWHQYPVVLE